MSKIFVTGATGLIGIKLVQRLKEEAWGCWFYYI